MIEIPLPDPARAAAAYLGSTATEWGSSRYGTARRCGREYDLHYNRGIQLRESPTYFEIGSLVHAGIAWVADGARLGLSRRYSDPLIAAAAQPNRRVPGWDEVDPLEEAERLLGCYCDRWGYEAAGFSDLGAEILGVEVPLRNYITLERARVEAGRNEYETLRLPARELEITTQADLILRLGNGEIAVVDHKTRAKKLPGDPGSLERSEYARRLGTRPQFIQTSWQVQMLLGLESPPPVIVNALVKTKQPAADRIRVEIRPAAIALWLEGVRATPFQDCSPNLSQCAPDIGSPCSYFRWCHGSEAERELHYSRRES